MFSKSMTNRMKAAAIAALMCMSVAATTVPVMTGSTMDVHAVSVAVGEDLAVKDVYEGYTADLAKSGIKNITLTLKADYTGNFSPCPGRPAQAGAPG